MDAQPSELFFEYALDLSRHVDQIFASFRESNRSNIKKAMKAGLEVKLENSLESLAQY